MVAIAVSALRSLGGGDERAKTAIGVMFIRSNEVIVLGTVAELPIDSGELVRNDTGATTANVGLTQYTDSHDVVPALRIEIKLSKT